MATNALQGLLRLLPRSQLLTGQVQTTDGLTSTCTLLGGGEVVARGSRPAGTWVWIRITPGAPAVLEGDAPDYPTADVAV
ncbi:MAG: hypothetical protein RLY78_3028 [Pseudomonadota bacterium]